MPAPDLETCLNIRPTVEAAIEAHLAAALPDGWTIFGTNDTGTKKTPWVEVELELGAPTGHYGKDQSGNFIHDLYEARLTVGVVSARHKDQGPEAVEAIIRSQLQTFRDSFDTVDLPYHRVIYLNETDNSADANGDTVTHRIAFDALLGIRPSAWPDPE